MQPKSRQTDLALRANLTLTLLACLTIFTGCRVVGPDHVGTPPPALAPNYKGQLTNQELTLLAQQELSHWWVHLNDPVLMQLIEVASQQNFDLQDATLRIMQARAEVGIVTGQLGPELDAGLDVLTVKRSANGRVSGATSVDSDPFGLFSIGVATTWELDLFGRIARSVEAARAIYGAEVENLRGVQTALLSDIAVAYTKIRLAQELMDIQEQNLILREQHLEAVRVRFEAGDVGLLDVTQAEAILYATRAQIPLLQQQVDINLNRIAVLVGEVPTQALESVIGFDRIPAPNQRIAVGVPADLLRRRPDVRLAEQQVAETSASIGVAESELYPRLSLLGTISFDSRNLSDLIDIDSLTFGVGPSFRWNILQWGRITCNIEAAKLRHKNAIINYQRAVLLGVEEVENGLAQFNTTTKADADLRRAVQLAKKSVGLAVEQYNAGRVDFNRLIEAQRRMLDSQVADANNRAAQLLSIVQTYKAAGGGWEAFEDAKSASGFTVTMEQKISDEEYEDLDYSSDYEQGERDTPAQYDSSDDLVPKPPRPETDQDGTPLDSQSRYESNKPASDSLFYDASVDSSQGEAYIDDLQSEIPRPPSENFNSPAGERLPNADQIELDPSKIDPSQFDDSIKSINVPSGEDFSKGYPGTSTPQFDFRGAIDVVSPDAELNQPFAVPNLNDNSALNRTSLDKALASGALDYRRHDSFYLTRFPVANDAESMVAEKPGALLIVNSSVKPKKKSPEVKAPKQIAVNDRPSVRSITKRTSRLARLPLDRKATTKRRAAAREQLAKKTTRPRRDRPVRKQEKTVARFPMRGPFMENSEIADRLNRSRQDIAAAKKAENKKKSQAKEQPELLARKDQPKKKAVTKKRAVAKVAKKAVATPASKVVSSARNNVELRVADSSSDNNNPLRRSSPRGQVVRSASKRGESDLRQPDMQWELGTSPSLETTASNASDRNLMRLPNVRFRSLPAVDQEGLAQPGQQRKKSGDVLAEINFGRLRQIETTSPDNQLASPSKQVSSSPALPIQARQLPQLPQQKLSAVGGKTVDAVQPPVETKVSKGFGAVVRMATEPKLPGRVANEESEEIRVGNTQVLNQFVR